MKNMLGLKLVLLSALVVSILPIFGVKAQETFLWGGDVPSTGELVVSPVLEAGRQYRIVARDVFLYDNVYRLAADAQYYTTSHNTYVWDNYFPAPGGHSFLQINGEDVNWGPFNNGYHIYTIYYTGTGESIVFRIVDWMDGDYSNNTCHFPVEIYEGPRPPRAETAYAYGGYYATCFRSMDFDMDGKRDFRNWGWSNGPLGPGHYEFEIWAGAAKCDLSKGDLVGMLTIDYDGSTATITYMMDADWTIRVAHLYVDGEILPRDDHGDYTVSPGLYPYRHYVDGPTYTFPVSGLSGPIYVVAHADVIEE